MKTTISHLQAKKGVEKLTAITAYDALMARIFDGEVDIILVGDSLKMSFYGESETTSATMTEMLYHTKAVCNGANKSFIIADMPFGSYSDERVAIKNALRFYKQTKADALKLEVDMQKVSIIRALSSEGIAVMAHIGLKPQFSRYEGGYKVKGKSAAESKALLECALACEAAGAFGVLIEGVKANVAKDITNALKVPTIGIGAGVHCDGQILVWSDAFGFFDNFTPKFVRHYMQGKEALKKAIRAYVKDIKNSAFPNQNESY